MQLRGWELTRASRIVIILLVVQHLGLAQVRTSALVTSVGPGPPGPMEGSPSIAALDADLPRSILAVTDCQTSAAISEHCSGPIPPDSLPLPRRLPRAPPAA
jgi:hypothetical protein